MKGKAHSLSFRLMISVIIALTSRGFAALPEQISLHNEFWHITVWPATLTMSAWLPGGTECLLSGPQADLGRASTLVQSTNEAQWVFDRGKVTVKLQLNGRDLSVRISSKKCGTFTWPVWKESEDMQALIWPQAEGAYIPLDDPAWREHLVQQSPWSTLESLSMPFWGVDYGDHCITWIATNPYNNAIHFDVESDKLQARFVHDFTDFVAKAEYGFVIHLNPDNSPVGPAKRFRQWLIGRGEFVGMDEKLARVPKAERLLGAAHVYLWGDDLFTRHDIAQRKWPQFCKTLVQQACAEQPSPGKHIKDLTLPQQWAQIDELASQEWPSKYLTREIAATLSRLLSRRDFYDPASWDGVAVPEQVGELLKDYPGELPAAQLCRLNGLLLHAAYAQFIEPPYTWGDGLSIKMLESFREHGFDRMRFCLSGWEGAERRPEPAEAADQVGYLFGTYDSYHSIHDPATRDSDQTWPTAQFDEKLWTTGPVLGRDGRARKGFAQIGCKLSPIAAQPYVHSRVQANMSKVPYSYYFVDCDATGEIFDDYSPFHPAGQADDIRARLHRMAWISDTFKVPVGSEGGHSFAAGVIHVAEGIFGPLVGWGDPDMTNKDSEYFLGRYWPADGPEIFLKQVPLKKCYEHLYYDPRFRLPLYEVVLHDSVVATHHWQNGSLKFKNVADLVALTELLYMVPPMYHMNLEEFAKHRDTMKEHYAFFSPLHRELGFSQMTDFKWLSPDRLLQRTVFAGGVEIVANFATEARQYDQVDIPARTALVRWTQSGHTRTFTCVGAADEPASSRGERKTIVASGEREQ